MVCAHLPKGFHHSTLLSGTEGSSAAGPYVVSCLSLPACVLSNFSRVRLFLTPWTAAHQAPLSTGSSRQEYWRGLPRPPPGDLPDPGIKPVSLMSPALAGRFFATSATWEGPDPAPPPRKADSRCQEHQAGGERPQLPRHVVCQALLGHNSGAQTLQDTKG